MKYTTISMLMVLAAVAAVSHSSAIDFSRSQSDFGSLPGAVGYGSEILPDRSYFEELSEGFDISEGNVNAVNGSSHVGGDPRLLFSGQYIRYPVSNKAHIHVQTWRGPIIKEFRLWQEGRDQHPSLKVSGGVGFDYVIVQMRSARGYGFHIRMEVYGK